MRGARAAGWLVGAAALFLVCVGCGGPTAALERQLKSEAATERAAAARTLGDLGPKAAPAQAALADALRDGAAEVRRQSAHALGRIGAGVEPATRDRLHAVLADDDRTVRLAAAYALAELAPDDNAPVAVLAEAARGGDPRACVALGRMGPAAAEATPALIIAASNPAALVRQKAVEALERIGANSPEAKATIERVKRQAAN